MSEDRANPHISARSSVLIGRLVRDFIWRHWPKIALAFLCMALAGGSTALRAFVAFPLAIRPIVAIGRRMRRVSVNTQVEQGQLTTLLSQTFQGARHVKAYGMEDYEERRAAGLFERIFRLIDRANRTRSR